MADPGAFLAPLADAEAGVSTGRRNPPRHPHELGGRTADGGRGALDGPGEAPSDPPPVRPLIARPNVRLGIAAGLLILAGVATALIPDPALLLVLTVLLVAGVLVLGLDRGRRGPRCRRCGATAEESGLCVLCATVRRQEGG